jgi:tetratricopeptide (TPR) repeat protein
MLYAEFDALALAAALFSLFCYPFLAFTDRIVFDGKRMTRTGPLWRLWTFLTGRPRSIKPRAFVHVETEALRALRRGANVTYLYRTSLFAQDISFRIGSGRGYREMIRTVLPMVADGCLDVRSQELRDHLMDTSLVLAQATRLKIPSPDVLDRALVLDKSERLSSSLESDSHSLARSDEFRSIGNQLKANGRLLQALEAFRRAVRLNPRNGHLLYEFGRCMQSLAAAKRDDRLDRRSRALLRLAELRSSGDTDLLSRLGETYFSVGLWDRAERAFKRGAESGPASYRIFRGLGELALHDGKIAHAITYFARSAEAAQPRQLFKWARSEADYLRHLSEDDEYMELEIGRINLFDTFEGARRTSTKVFVSGLPLIIMGIALENELVAEVGWAVSGISLVIGFACSGLRHAFESRIPFELMERDR